MVPIEQQSKASEHRTHGVSSHVHYIDQANKRRYVTEDRVEVRQISQTESYSRLEIIIKYRYFVRIVRNVVSPTGLKEVLIPSWSVAGGQDDLIWHKAVRQSDGFTESNSKSRHRHIRSVPSTVITMIKMRRRYVTETVEVQKTS